MNRAVVVIVIAASAVLCFALGRASASGDDEAEEREAESRRITPAAAPRATRVVVTPSSRLGPAAADAPTTPPPVPAAPECRQVGLFATRCARHLQEREAELAAVEALRIDREGTPIPPKATTAAMAPRFGPSALTTSLQQAFQQTRVPGDVDGVDCSEFPCIAFGRIRGAEDQMERLEKAESLAVYRHDILTVLLWTSSDEPANTAARERGNDDAAFEQSLFAVALYPTTDQALLGDNLDRRIRSRTSELWNTMAPSDETAAH